MHYESVKIKRFAHVYCHHDWSWEPTEKSAWTDDDGSAVRFNFDLWTILQGTGKLKAPEGTYDLKGGDCFILRGDQRYFATHDPDDPLSMIAVHYDYIDKKGDVFVPKHTHLYRHIEYMDFFTHMLNHIEMAWTKNDLKTAELWLQTCLIEINRQDQEMILPSNKKTQFQHIQRICREISRYPAKNWQINNLASHLNCTPRHFGRLFKQITGISTQNYIMNARIEAAKGLLHSSNYTIGRIAERVGYSDIYYFSRQFKQKTGISPSQYRS